MFKRILLPLDGSAMAEPALPHVIAQAQHFDRSGGAGSHGSHSFDAHPKEET
jgi:hypothetical protein